MGENNISNRRQGVRVIPFIKLKARSRLERLIFKRKINSIQFNINILLSIEAEDMIEELKYGSKYFFAECGNTNKFIGNKGNLLKAFAISVTGQEENLWIDS